MTQFEDQILYTMTLSVVEAGVIPMNMPAIKDGFLYLSGNEVGRVMRVEYMSPGIYVHYIRSKGRDK